MPFPVKIFVDRMNTDFLNFAKSVSKFFFYNEYYQLIFASPAENFQRTHHKIHCPQLTDAV